MRSTRYQDGSLRLRARSGEKSWEYRWYEVQIDGSRRRRSKNIGPLREYPTEAAALKAVSALRASINIETPLAQIKAISFGTLVEPMVLMDVSTGLRIGELLALRWRDVDFENLEIAVTHSVLVNQGLSPYFWASFQIVGDPDGTL